MNDFQDSPMRGLMYGLLFSLPLWGLIVLAAWLVLR